MSKKTIIASLAILAVTTFTLAENAEAYPREDKGQQQYHQQHDGEQYHKNFKQGRGRQHNPAHAEQMAKVRAQYEKLTEAQKAELEKMKDKLRAEMNPIRTSLASKKAEYRALMQNNNPNPKDAGQIAGDISRLQQEEQELRREHAKSVEEKFGIEMAMGKHGMGRGMGRGGHGMGHGHSNY